MMIHSPKKEKEKKVNDNLEDCGESSILLLRSVLLGKTSWSPA